MSLLLQGVFERLVRLGPRPSGEPAEPDPSATLADRRRSPRRQTLERALLEWIAEDDVEHSELAHIEDRSESGFGLQVSARPEVGAAVLITPRGESPVKGMVRHAGRNQEGWFIGVEILHEERRRYDRRPLDEEAVLCWNLAGASEDRFAVRIRNASPDGVQLECVRSIPPESPVRLIHDGWRRYGSVSYSKPHGPLFQVGIRFTGPARRDDTAPEREPFVEREFSSD